MYHETYIVMSQTNTNTGDSNTNQSHNVGRGGHSQEGSFCQGQGNP